MAKTLWYVRLRLDKEDHSTVYSYHNISASDRASAAHLAKRRASVVGEGNYFDYYVEEVKLMEEVDRLI